MSNTMSPRAAGPDALKRWNKDAWRLIARLGLGWGVLWCLGLPALALWAGEGLGINPGVSILLVLYLAQVAGVVLEPIRYRALDRAAAGKPADPFADMGAGLMEVASRKDWYGRRVVGQLLAFVLLMSITAAVVMIASSSDSEAPAKSSSSLISLSQNLMTFMLMVPVILRRDGMLSFDFFLRGRHGLSNDLADNLLLRARLLNRAALGFGVLILLAAFLLLNNITLVGLWLMPVFSWYHSAFTRCAYHDIFEGGTGVEEKVAKKVESAASQWLPARIPV